MVEYVEVDIEDVYKAIEKNGFEWVRSQFNNFNADGEVYAGCVLGQAAVNLGVEPSKETLGTSYYDTLVGQLNKYPAPPADSKWYLENQLALGNTIISWNDRSSHEGHYMAKSEDDSDRYVCPLGLKYDEAHKETYDVVESWWVPDVYYLNSYEEVVQMCYDVLSPHFGSKIQVIKREWKIPASLLEN